MNQEIAEILLLLDDVSNFTASLKHISSQEWQTIDTLCDNIRNIITKNNKYQI